MLETASCASKLSSERAEELREQMGVERPLKFNPMLTSNWMIDFT